MRCSTCTREFVAAIASAISPVPSGDASSTISMLIDSCWRSTASTSRSMLVRSLYVGTITSAFSGNLAPLCHESGSEHDQRQGYRGESDRLAPVVLRAGECQRHLARARRKLHSYERVIRSAHGRGMSIHRGAPARVVIL